MLQNGLFIVLGLVGLYAGGTLFVGASATLARRMGMSSLMVGLTVVAVGTSLPELIVSLGAAVSGQSEIALGNIVGSNIANVGLILGVSGLIFPLTVQASMLRREIPIMVGASSLMLLLALDGEINRLDGVLLIVGIVAFLGWTVINTRRTPATPQPEAESGSVSTPLVRVALSLVGGLALLLIAARLTVDGATGIARAFGMSELIIGITLVAVGTSLPELVTSVTAALQKQSDIAVGNVVGSNIFNVLGILGTTAIVRPIPVASSVIRIDAPIMLGFAILLLPFLLDRRLSKQESILFLALYLTYMLLLFWLR